MNQDIQHYGDKVAKGIKNTNNWVRVGLALLVAAGLYVGLPYGVSIVENLFQITLALTKTLLVGIPMFFGLSFFWANRSLLKKFRERLSRKLWQSFIYKDPLDYIQGVIIEFEQALGKIDEARIRLRTVLAKLKAKADELIAASQRGMKEAEAYAEQGDEANADISAYYASRNNTTVDGITQSYMEVEQSLVFLNELATGLKHDIGVMKIDLEDMRMNLEIATITAEAANVMESAMQGDPTEIAMREYAKWAYQDQVAKAKARFDSFLEKAKPIIESKRIEQTINTKDGRKALEAFRTDRDLGGLKDFSQRLENIKSKNPNLYTGGNANLNSIIGGNPNTVRRTNTGGARFGSFDHLQ